MDPYTVTLRSPTQAYDAITSAWRLAKTGILAGHRFVLTLKPETRSDPQNAKYHAMLGDIAKQVDWCGKKRDILTWKRLTTAAWLRARGESVEVLPAIDGHGVDLIFEHTSRLSKPLMAELITYTEAWGSEHGVEWSE